MALRGAVLALQAPSGLYGFSGDYAPPMRSVRALAGAMHLKGSRVSLIREPHLPLSAAPSLLGLVHLISCRGLLLPDCS